MTNQTTSGSKTNRTTTNDARSGSKSSQKIPSRRVLVPAGSKTVKRPTVKAKNKEPIAEKTPAGVRRRTNRKSITKKSKMRPNTDGCNEKNCSGCRRPLPTNYKGKTCEPCLERGRINRAKDKAKNVQCQAIVLRTNTRCIFKIHPDKTVGGHEYCKVHRTHWEQKLKAAGRENVRWCKGMYRCNRDDVNDKTKAILADDNPTTICPSCSSKANEEDRKRRNNKKAASLELKKTNPNLAKCIKCPLSKTYTVD